MSEGRLRLTIEKRYVFSLLLSILFFISTASPILGVDFTYSGPDCSLVYRFTPNTGTLCDLVAIYNGSYSFYPAFYGGIVEFYLAGKRMYPWESLHSSQLINESQSHDVYTAKFRWTYKNDSLEFTIKISLKGKTLTMEWSSASDKVMQFGLDRSEETPNPKIIELPYGHNVLFSNGIFTSAIMDITRSNAYQIYPSKYYYSDKSAYFAPSAFYKERTDKKRNTLKETVYMTVSPKIEDTFYQIPNPVSPYRKLLSRYLIADMWNWSFYNYLDWLKYLASQNMKDLFVIVHAWQRFGYDNGLPTTYPASKEMGGDLALKRVSDFCKNHGYLFSLHTNYDDFYPNSPDWNPKDLALDSEGKRIKAWFNPATGIQAFLMKPSRSLFYARKYEPLIHQAYGTTATYVDVLTAILPSDFVDYDALVPGSAKQYSTFKHYLDVISYMRKTHSGPIAGESVGTPTGIWAGYIDAVEGDPRSRFDCGENKGGTDVPTIVDYKLKVIHPLSVPHGMSCLQRFYYNKFSGYTQKELERYLATEIAFGNAAFLDSAFFLPEYRSELKRHYQFLSLLQKNYLPPKVKEIFYYVGGKFVALSAALKAVLPSASNADVNFVLCEKLGILKITYSNKLTIYVNRTKKQTFQLTYSGSNYMLQPNNFLAIKNNKVIAYSAEVEGKRKDYIASSHR
jgi:hypothetical protein